MHEQQTETSTPETGPEHALETDVAPAIWVGSLADYNAGRLHGSWIDAHQRPEQLYTAIEQVLATSPEAAETGLPSEEWGIFDYEGFGTYRLGEYEDIGRVALLASGIVEWGPAFAAWVDDNREPERIELFQDAYLGHYVSLSAYGDYLTTENGIEEQLDRCIDTAWLRAYVTFDSDQLVHDLQAGGDVYTVDDGDGGIWIFDGHV